MGTDEKLQQSLRDYKLGSEPSPYHALLQLVRAGLQDFYLLERDEIPEVKRTHALYADLTTAQQAKDMWMIRDFSRWIVADAVQGIELLQNFQNNLTTTAYEYFRREIQSWMFEAWGVEYTIHKIPLLFPGELPPQE